MNPKTYTASVVSAEYISPQVIHIIARAPDKVTFKPGQYASLFVDSGLQRLYSFATNNTEHVEFLINIAPNGPGSNYIKKLKPRDTIRFLAPFGHFTFNYTSPRPCLFIATGTGIAPLRAHIKKLIEIKDRRPITLIFGNKDDDHFILYEEFKRLSDTYSHVTFFPVYSKASKKWSQDIGCVTDILSDMCMTLPDYDSYICGNGPMILSIMTLLRENNVPDDQIYTESYT